ncbi:Gonadotropin-releasing hormone receptor [Eumeta japonica]|uniref:Gonadotropin-releasing hormone receptor n=1 Tax=Eumeta variegata TaxID=151549 RepID=A0A4C1ZJN9_EUMVA|nr:Gonadotropin-releasing hormone receptor [Eumeta japonica]
MGSEGNNTTSSNSKDVYIGEFTFYKELSSVDEGLVGYERWSIEKCLENELINDTRADLTSRLFIHNGTELLCLDHAPVATKAFVIRAGVLSVLAVLSFFGNIATMISIKRSKRGRRRARHSWTAVYSLIFQLSIADLLVTIFCIAGEAAWSFTVQWYAGNFGCKIFKFMQMFALYLSTFILVLIGVDRWLAVRYPMKSMATATRSGRLVIVAWILSFLLSIPQDPKRVFNADETGFQLCPCTSRVLAAKGDKNIYAVEQGNSKENVTVLFTFSADGRTCPPLIVFPYKRLPEKIATSVPSKWGIGRRDTGWMTADVFNQFITELFAPYLAENNIKTGYPVYSWP